MQGWNEQGYEGTYSLFCQPWLGCDWGEYNMLSPSPHSHRRRNTMTPLEPLSNSMLAHNSPGSIWILSTSMSAINLGIVKHTLTAFRERPERDKILWLCWSKMKLYSTQHLKNGREVDRHSTLPWKITRDKDHENEACDMVLAPHWVPECRYN